MSGYGIQGGLLLIGYTVFLHETIDICYITGSTTRNLYYVLFILKETFGCKE